MLKPAQEIQVAEIATRVVRFRNGR